MESPQPSSKALLRKRPGKVPQLVDITASTQIHFEHLASPDQRYIVESMGGGVALLDYDGDGWLDIYFTNGPSVAMALEGKKPEALSIATIMMEHSTDVTEKAGVGYPCWAMGASVGTINNDGHPDLIVSCFGGGGALSQQWGWNLCGCDQGGASR